MKYLCVFFPVFFASIFSLPAQYTDKQYPVRVEPDVYYGTTLHYAGCPVDLFLDLYKPVNNDLCRPVLVLLHGGLFTRGSKTDPIIVQTARDMAARGYVVASANYRLGWHLTPQASGNCPPGDCWGAGLIPCSVYAADTAEPIRAAYRAMQDTRGAIRFLKTRHALDSTNTRAVFVGGHDAGGIAALWTGFLDRSSERPASTFAISNAPPPFNSPEKCPQGPNCPEASRARPDLGSIDGELHLSKSYDASVAGVLAFSGSIPALEWLENSTQAPVLYLFHQQCDHVVPCYPGRIMGSTGECLTGCCPQPLCLPATGMPFVLGGGAIRDFLKEHPELNITRQDDIVVNGPAISPAFGCQHPNSGIPYCRNPNFEPCPDFLYNTGRMNYIAGFLNVHIPAPDCFSQVQAAEPEIIPAVKIWPNPVKNKVTVSIDPEEDNRLLKIEVLSLDGRSLETTVPGNTKQQEIVLSATPKGMVLLKIYTSRGLVLRKLAF